jgi:hypothetical protein
MSIVASENGFRIEVDELFRQSGKSQRSNTHIRERGKYAIDIKKEFAQQSK